MWTRPTSEARTSRRAQAASTLGAPFSVEANRDPADRALSASTLRPLRALENGGQEKSARVEVGQIKLEGGLLVELFEQHASDAGRLAYLLTGDRELAEDLVQDAFVKLAGRFIHVRDPGGLHAYLRVTVVNLATSHHRRRAVERRFAERESGREQTTTPSDLSDRDQLQRALLSLPERQRTAIVLRYYEDLDVAQTASVMRCSEGTVKALSSRGIARLRPLIGDIIDDD